MFVILYILLCKYCLTIYIRYEFILKKKQLTSASLVLMSITPLYWCNNNNIQHLLAIYNALL